MFLQKRYADQFAEAMKPGWSVVEREWKVYGVPPDWHDHTSPHYVYMVCEGEPAHKGDPPVCEGDRPVFYTQREADEVAKDRLNQGRIACVAKVEVWVGAKA
jgi:hypothetical protein